MKIREIYDKPIDRDINPAVVVSNKNAETVKAEINEYIFTDELIEKLYLILDTVQNKKKGKTGIWVNGYYGSGKSHFIKYIHYCLNPETSTSALDHFMEAVMKYDTTKAGKNENITPSNVALMRKRMAQAACDNIMFNVEDETDDGSGERLTRIFLNMFNKFRGYNPNDIPLALLFEKYLDNKGKFGEFKQLVTDELGHDWKSDAADVASYELESVLGIAKQLVPELDTVALHAKLTNPDTFKISITSSLIPELREFLQGKDKDYRLVFLVDEVSQYIGTNKEILLNFQNIVERVSEDCNNQVWITCTAQQTLDDVSSGAKGSVDVQDEFGKILGRFDTRISLESNDASYITQKRVLDKNSKGIEVLGKMYRDKKDAIENQFKMRHELYKGYHREEEFILAYPFVPYQFKLIAHVFESFQSLRFVIKEVKDNERSVLGITHYTAKQNAEVEVGHFMPFDAFFNKQFLTNLTHRGRRAIDNGLTLSYVKNNLFAERVVKTLFMISNLPQPTLLTFPSNLDNLTVLMMTDVDQNKLQLQNKIKEVLDKLIEESIIREEKGSYFFFNEDEIDVQMMIKSLNVGFDDKLSEFDEFFRKLTKIAPKHTFGQNDFRVAYAVDDKEFFRSGDFKLTVLFTDTSDIQQKALNNSGNDLCICVNEWYHQDAQFKTDFEWFCKTKKYFRNNSEAATGERSNTLEKFRARNEDLRKKLVAKLENNYSLTRFLSGQQVLEANEINGTLPHDRFRSLLDKHLERVYKYHRLSASYAKTAIELRTSAASLQQEMPDLTPPEQMVDDFISNHGNQVAVSDLINHFEKAPFGWRDTAVLEMLVKLVKKKKREFEYRNQPRFSVTEFINKALSTPERPVCIVKAGEAIDQQTIDKAIMNFREVFNLDLSATSDGNELSELIIAKLVQISKEYISLENDYHGKYPFGESFYSLRNKLQEWATKRNPKQLFQLLENEKLVVKELFDKAKGMKDFANRARADYDAIKRFYQDNQQNFKALPPSAQEKAEKMGEFLKLEDPRFEFRHVRKAYDELKAELKELVENLKAGVVQQYTEVFAELKKDAESYAVNEPHIYSDEDRTIKTIQALSAITDLKLKKAQLSEFKSSELKKIVAHASKKAAVLPKENGTGVDVKLTPVGEPQEYYITGIKSKISTEEELEEYLQKVRKEMLALLQQNKTIIIK
ncbi:hypothetical protein AAE02nite_32150 [Adhaeribacter aerolatus]|uniref:BREX system P-loop protein BrxC n=1 Tax=Adhaeribacter aerolatus TaxID=670289 RepID=A0A512B0R4_9BACT|nr:BREX system P-loop protein BrxC [Adhaeribacter aerolatus]GEO05551.1 hypothetical protein AAE02nite_32150 [Adhaeribacter aerolatus]